MRGLGPGGALLALVGVAVAGPSIAANLEAPAWAIAPEDAACHMEFELTSRSGAIAPVALVSDGYRVALRFAKMGLPAEAFLPIRIDGRPFSNLVQRTGQEGVALMGLSDETLSAMRHGKTLQIAWLSEEAVSGSLAGAAQGISDLKTCGAQVAADHRSREAELEASRARQAAEARAKAVSDEQLKAARAQTAAADAERQRVAALARKTTAEADELTAQAEQQRAYAEAERQRSAEDARRRAIAQQYYDQDRGPPPPSYGYYRPYYSPR
jgi:hypothetical protein